MIYNSTSATSSSSQTNSKKSTPTQSTTPQKKHNEDKSTKKESPAPKSIQDTDTQCPNSEKSLDDLTPTELKDLLICTRNEKETLAHKVETLEEIIQDEEIIIEEPKKDIPSKKFNIFKSFSSKPRCPYGNVSLKKLNQSQLEEVYAYTLSNKMDAPFMIDLLDQLIKLSDNHTDVKKYKLQLADAHYDVHHLEKAAACYEDFSTLYPASKEYEYSLYKAITCIFELALDADRDQTNTKKTILLIKEFLKRAENNDLIQEAHTILQTCYDRLFDHELYVFNFYLKKKNFTAAQLRLDYVIKSCEKTVTNFNKKVAAMEKDLHLAQNPVKPDRRSFIQKYLA